MKLSLTVNDKDVGRRIWKSLDPCVRWALLGFGLVRIDDDGRPCLDELPAETLARIEKACGVRI